RRGPPAARGRSRRRRGRAGRRSGGGSPATGDGHPPSPPRAHRRVTRMEPDARNQAAARMRERGVDPRAITVFEHYWQQLADGARGKVPESEIDPLVEVPELSAIEADDEERAAALRQVAVVKLNGGLGTSMGVSGPKSALVARDGLSF